MFPFPSEAVVEYCPTSVPTEAWRRERKLRPLVLSLLRASYAPTPTYEEERVYTILQKAFFNADSEPICDAKVALDLMLHVRTFLLSSFSIL